jgi:hypothetical protein
MTLGLIMIEAMPRIRWAMSGVLARVMWLGMRMLHAELLSRSPSRHAGVMPDD